MTSTAPFAVTGDQLRTVGGLLAELYEGDPLAQRTDLRTFFWERPWHKPISVTIAENRDVPVFPAFAAVPPHRRDCTIHALSLGREILELARGWDVLNSWPPGHVNSHALSFAWRVLEPPYSGLRMMRKPSWLTRASGADVHAILSAAFLPVVTALKVGVAPNAATP